eukprot:2347635-Lingulodinium_polyedra.AAC.1
MAGWLEKVVGSLPARAGVVIMMDANSEFGLVREHGKTRPVESNAVCSEFHHGMENSHGTVIRQFLEKHGMLIAHAFRQLPP